MTGDNNVVSINARLVFSPFRMSDIQSAGSGMESLQATIRVISTREGVLESLRGNVDTVMDAYFASQMGTREFAQEIKQQNALAISKFKTDFNNIASNPQEADGIMAILAKHYNHRVSSIRQSYNEALAAMEPLRRKIATDTLQKETIRLDTVLKDERAASAQTALIEKCKLDIAELERAKSQLEEKKSGGGSGSKPSKDADKEPLSGAVGSNVLQILGSLYSGAVDIFVLQDLLNGISDLSAKLKAYELELEKQQQHRHSLLEQRKLVDALRAFEAQRSTYEQQVDIVLSGVRQFVEACEAPEPDMKVRVATFSANAESLDGYLAPMANS
jgi:hypothetical protein